MPRECNTECRNKKWHVIRGRHSADQDAAVYVGYDAIEMDNILGGKAFNICDNIR